MSLTDEIPGLRAAIESETTARDDSFVGAPEFIGGVEVLPMTLEHFALLLAIKSPFVCSGIPDAKDCALFLWVVSARYARVRHSRLMRWHRFLFIRRLRRLDAVELLRGITGYVSLAFQDAPGGSKSNGAPAYWSALTGIVDAIASNYYWSEQEIIRLPLRRLWQYLRRIQKRSDPGCILFNPSDRIRGEWLKARNANQ